MGLIESKTKEGTTAEEMQKTNEQEEELQSATSNGTISPTSPKSLTSPEGVTMSNFPPNNDMEMNSNQTNEQQEHYQPTTSNGTISPTSLRSLLSPEETYEQQKELQLTTSNTTISTTLMSPEGVTMSNYPPNDDMERNSNQANEQQEKFQPNTSNGSILSTFTRSPERVTMSNFPPNNDIEMKSNLTNEPQEKLQPVSSINTVPTISPTRLIVGVTMSNSSQNNDIEMQPLSQIPFPLLPNHLNNRLQQHRPPHQPLPPLPIARIPIPYGLLMNPMQSNAIVPMNPMQSNADFDNNSSTPVNGFMKSYNQVPPPQSFPTDNIGLCRMPQPTNVQQNAVSKNVNQTIVRRRKGLPFQSVIIKNRKQRKDPQPSVSRMLCGFEVKVLTKIAIEFLLDDFEIIVKEYLEDAQILTDEYLYDDIAEKLRDGCKELNLEAEVKCFGSRMNGIGWYKSDVDMNIIIPDCDLTARSFLEKLAEVLPEQGYWTDGQYIKSRVSLIRACYDRELNVDVTFNNVLAMANTRLTQYFYRIQPECPKLVAFIKILLKKANLNPPINTYTVNLLVFFYFQQKGYLPKVMDLIETSSLKYWPNEFTQKSLEELGLPRIEGPLSELYLGFMNFYIYDVNFENDILSTFTGSIIPKRSFWSENPVMKAHYSGLLQFLHDNRGMADGIKLSFTKDMCVQDPFSHDHNVTRRISKVSLMRFQELCEETPRFLLQEKGISSILEKKF